MRARYVRFNPPEKRSGSTGCGTFGRQNRTGRGRRAPPSVRLLLAIMLKTNIIARKNSDFETVSADTV